jgi:hypothetical protein
MVLTPALTLPLPSPHHALPIPSLSTSTLHPLPQRLSAILSVLHALPALTSINALALALSPPTAEPPPQPRSSPRGGPRAGRARARGVAGAVGAVWASE